jgi:hypothetical protein
MIYMYIDLQIFTTIWLGIKLTKKPQSSKTYTCMLICTHMNMDVMIHQKTNSLKKLNKIACLIENSCNKTYVSISNMFLKTNEVIDWGEGKWTMNSNGL